MMKMKTKPTVVLCDVVRFEIVKQPLISNPRQHNEVVWAYKDRQSLEVGLLNYHGADYYLSRLKRRAGTEEDAEKARYYFDKNFEIWRTQYRPNDLTFNLGPLVKETQGGKK